MPQLRPSRGRIIIIRLILVVILFNIFTTIRNFKKLTLFKSKVKVINISNFFYR